MPLTMSAVTSSGDFVAGDYGGGDDDVAFGDDFAQQFALPAVEVFVLGAGVAAGVLRVFGFDGQFDEAAAEALDLFFRGGAHVVGGSYGAETAGGGDGLQSGDAGADDENAGGSDRSGGGSKHRENSWERVCGDDHGFIAADGGHRGEGVHALRAGGAGHQFDGKRGDAALGDLLNGRRGLRAGGEIQSRI